MILDNLTPAGDLDNNKFCRALLLHRNTPDPSTKVSPAEIVFGHPTRDSLPKPSYRPREAWSSLASKREASFLHRHFKRVESLDTGARKLAPLQLKDQVYIQNQQGNKPLQWDKSGVIVEVLPFDSYMVMMDRGESQNETVSFYDVLNHSYQSLNQTSFYQRSGQFIQRIL